MEPLTPEEEIALLKRLLAGTQSNQLAWQQSESSAYVFHAEVGRFTYVIASTDTDDVAPYRLAIYDNTVSTPSKVHEVITSDWGRANNDLAALYVFVKKRHLGIENVAADIFSELDKFGLRG